MHLLRKTSVKHLSGRGYVWSGMCLVGEVSVGDVSGWENVHRGCVWSEKCPSGMCLVGEMSVGEVSVGKESVGEMYVGDVSGNRQKHLGIFLDNKLNFKLHIDGAIK